MRVLYPADRSASTINDLMSSTSGEILFFGDPRFELDFGSTTLERMADVLNRSDAVIFYSDAKERPRIDYQPGSIRDDFDFGPLIGLSMSAVRSAVSKHGGLEQDLHWSALYDLRLKISTDHPIVRVPEPLYGARDPDTRESGERQFDYVDPRQKEYQDEMERVATAHLRRTGAYLDPRFRRVTEVVESFPVKASIVIPVRNRESTLGVALSSALEQQADFSYNVIVVDNHSTDSTGAIIEETRDQRLVHLIPGSRDLGIGGCWNEAIYSDRCGRYALQLDSDDLFSEPSVLARIVDRMETERYAMLVGSYRTVGFELDEVLPGLVDHREWTPENGHNNALRVNGFGAPRAYDVTVVRRFGFPNVSYGEDYVVGLRTCREYEIGRIFEPLYLCRRWAGNSDSAPPVEVLNRFNTYKDGIRTSEIRARVALNQSRDSASVE
jgi:hypothetical protein